MRIAAFLIALFIATPVWAAECYLGRWEWYTSGPVEHPEYWRAPGGNAIGVLDLRGKNQLGKFGGTPLGFGLFCYSAEQTHPLLLRHLFKRSSDPVPDADRNWLKNRFGFKTIEGNTWRELIWDLLTMRADPKGETRWPPLRPNHKGIMRLRMKAIQLDEQAKITPQSKEWPMVLASIQNDYRIMSQREDPKLVGMWLDVQEKKYNIPYYAFIPGDALIRVASIPHETTVSDDFNCASSDTLGCDENWTEQAGDYDNDGSRADKGANGSGQWATVDTALSSDDHYAQADLYIDGVTEPGVVVRADGTTTETYYRAYARMNTDQCAIIRYNSGSATTLVSEVSCGESIDNGDTLYLELDGSDYDGQINSSSFGSGTDGSPITGQNYVGITGYWANDEWDNFEGGDLTAPPATRRIIMVQ